MKFQLGRLLITPGAQDAVNNDDIQTALGRHVNGDWGDVDEDEPVSNDFSAGYRQRILWAYTDRNDVKFWIITEADRSVTTILLPEEYRWISMLVTKRLKIGVIETEAN